MLIPRRRPSPIRTQAALPELDLILAGGGLANGLLAYRLKTTRPELKLLVIEQAPVLGGGATWCFHARDLTKAQNRWITPFVAHDWSYYDVAFPGLTRRVGLTYRCVSSARFAELLTGLLGPDLRTGTRLEQVDSTSVRLADGTCLRARAVIDGRGYRPSPHMVQRFQKFLGLEVRLKAPHGLGGPIMMDATIRQDGGFRFFYVLPLAPDRLLIEDTCYADGPSLDHADLRAGIADYAAAHGWDIDHVVRQESGVLPLTLSGDMNAYWRELATSVPRAGMRAGLYHPVTGYSLPDAVRLADQIAAMRDMSAATIAATVHGIAKRRWRGQAYFRLLNRLLFLAGPPEERFIIMRRFFQMSESLIARFFAGNLSLYDRARILVGRPPVPFGSALRAIVATGR